MSTAHERKRPAVAGEGESGQRQPSEQAPATEPLSVSLVRLLRADRRRRLVAALAGSSQDRWDYAFGRQLTCIQVELLAWGTAIYDRNKAAERIVRNYHRLERLAEARRE